MMKTLLHHLILLFFLLSGIGIINAQNKIDFTENFRTILYHNTVGSNGLLSESFSGQYRVYNHGGSLRLGFKLSVLPNASRSYTYKGKTYSATQIPEINAIKITKVTGSLTISHSSLTSSEKERKGVEIYIGGGLDHSGTLDGNNIEITDKIPESFHKSTSVLFTPSSISFDASDVNFAIEKYLEKEKDKEAAKQNQEKYDNFLRDADRLFAAKNYDHALAQYYSASYIDVPDKTKAENGITKTRKILEEEAEKEKNIEAEKPKDPNAHTYKSGECKLAGATITGTPHCPLCAQQNKKETEAKANEDKRVADVKFAKAEAERKAKEIEEKRIAQEKAEAERKAKEEEKQKKEAEYAKNELESKLKAQLTKGNNTSSNDFDFEKLKLSGNSNEYIISYNEIPINRIPRSRYQSVHYISPTKYLRATSNGEIWDVLDPLGNVISGLEHNFTQLIDDQLYLFTYESDPEFIKESAARYGSGRIDKTTGYYNNKEKALNAIMSYEPPQGTFAGFLLDFKIVKVKAMKVNKFLKIISEEKGYFVEYKHK